MAGMAEVLAEGTGYPGMTGIIPCFVLYRCNVCNGAGSIAKSLDNGRFFIFIRALFSLRHKSPSPLSTPIKKTVQMSDKAGLYDICKHTKLSRKYETDSA